VKKISQKIISELIEKADFYNCPDFIKSDPIQIPHSFSKKEDIEISAFLSATIAWGNRTSIINNAKRLMLLMDNSPYDFVKNAKGKELLPLTKFVHRTYNGDDCLGFMYSLQNIYKDHGGLEGVFTKGFKKSYSVESSLLYFHEIFMRYIELHRTGKHVSNISKGSAAKRLNMYLRWLVRSDNKGVDFGLWKEIPASALMIPLDVHVGNVAREMGLLERKQNDWKAVVELTEVLKSINSNDPIIFDFALFGTGVNKKNKNLGTLI
jgi:uncharacterized protein (TIGR02757 family)